MNPILVRGCSDRVRGARSMQRRPSNDESQMQTPQTARLIRHALSPQANDFTKERAPFRPHSNRNNHSRFSFRDTSILKLEIMAENVPPATTAAANGTPGATAGGPNAGNQTSTRGLPYYEKLRRELRDTINKKRQMDKALVCSVP